MQPRRRERLFPVLGLVAVFVFVIPSFFLNIYLFLSAHETELQCGTTVRHLKGRIKESDVDLERRDQQLKEVISSKIKLRDSLKEYEGDCVEVAQLFERLWDLLAEFFGFPEGNNEADLEKLLEKLRDENSNAAGNPWQPGQRFPELESALKSKDELLRIHREFTHATVPRKIRVYWATECGCTGIQVEAINLVYPLWQKGLNILLNPCTSACDFKLPSYFQDMLDQMATADWGLMQADVIVVHYSYNGICPLEKLSNRTYNVMRAMFETDSLDPFSVQRCNSKLIQEIWVPTTFNAETFSRAGVSNPLVVMPESVDVYLFDPERLRLTSEQFPNHVAELVSRRRNFNFFSNFKFEERKNWKGLLRAYVEEFAGNDDVALFIFTHRAWEGEPTISMRAYIRDELRFEMPPSLVIIERRLTTEQLPFLYSVMDAFVLPTHGEGWGLPILEAMLMEMPVIVTDWGGSTEFAGGSNFSGFPIEVERMEPAWGKPEAGKWAVPSHASLRAQMREVYTNTKEAKQRGKRARAAVVGKYSQEAVALKYLDQFLKIESQLSSRGLSRPIRRTNAEGKS